MSSPPNAAGQLTLLQQFTHHLTYDEFSHGLDVPDLAIGEPLIAPNDKGKWIEADVEQPLTEQEQQNTRRSLLPRSVRGRLASQVATSEHRILILPPGSTNAEVFPAGLSPPWAGITPEGKGFPWHFALSKGDQVRVEHLQAELEAHTASSQDSSATDSLSEVNSFDEFMAFMDEEQRNAQDFSRRSSIASYTSFSIEEAQIAIPSQNSNTLLAGLSSQARRRPSAANSDDVVFGTATAVRIVHGPATRRRVVARREVEEEVQKGSVRKTVWRRVKKAVSFSR